MIKQEWSERMIAETGVSEREIEEVLGAAHRAVDPLTEKLEGAGGDFNRIMEVVGEATVNREFKRKALKLAIEVATTPLQCVRILHAIEVGEPSLRRTAILKLANLYAEKHPS